VRAAGDETMAGAEGDAVDRQGLLYCERSVELFTDLLSQLPTRAFVHTLLEDKAVLVKCKLSRLHSQPAGAT
jgi:intron-binding protein aquarius